MAIIGHILVMYVQDQDRSTMFYAKVLGEEPTLYVPGMTEFALSDGGKLGLMPAAGIKRLLGDSLPDPMLAAGIPRAEIYLRVENAAQYHQRALEHGAQELSGLEPRDWGECVAYSLDLDGHVLAFAEAASAGP
jgi:catechol 2,3-dioxygenase-like lactoylglutathione lyase family enzyme